MLKVKGNLKVKDVLTKTECLTCSPEDIVSKIVKIVDVAVDGSSYLCIAEREGNTIGLVDIHKQDAENIKIFDFDFGKIPVTL